MNTPRKFLIEGIDRLGKDTLISGLRGRLGYHHVIHCEKPMLLDFYTRQSAADALRLYQVDTFRTMFAVLRDASLANVIYNRAHLGECVYAPLYRKYAGDYVFDLEREFAADRFVDVRLILLTEDFEASTHFRDDGQSLGASDRRRDEQELFSAAFARSVIPDKRVVNVTDPTTGGFRPAPTILDEVLA